MPRPCSTVATTRWSARSSPPPPRPITDGGGQRRCRTRRADLETFVGLVGPRQPQRRPARRPAARGHGRRPDRDDARQEHVASAVSTMDAVSSQVTTPRRSRSRSPPGTGTIPLTIRTTSGMPLQVSVHLRSQKLEFPDGDDDPARAGRGVDAHRHPRARADLGRVPARRSTSRTPDGRRSLSMSRYTVRSTAVSGAGLVLSIGAGVFLVVWWARHWHRTRRSAPARRHRTRPHPTTATPSWRSTRFAAPWPSASSPTAAATSPTRRSRSPRHRGRPAVDPLRRRRVRRPQRAQRRGLLREARRLRGAARDGRAGARASSRRRSAASSEAGADAVVCINLSSDLSATMQSAQNAAKAAEGDLDVRVVDSRSITSGLGTQVLLAAEAAAGGASADEIVALVEDLAAAHPRVRRPRHARQPEEGRPHRRRPGAARLAAVDQAHRRHLHGQGRGGRQGPHPQEGARGAPRQGRRGRRHRAPVRAPTASPPTSTRCSTCSPRSYPRDQIRVGRTSAR